MPTSGAYLDGNGADTLTIRASARDDLSPRPTLRFIPPTPTWMLDQDGDATNSTVSARIQQMFEGDLQISVEAATTPATCPPSAHSCTTWIGAVCPPSSRSSTLRARRLDQQPQVGVQVTSPIRRPR
jgi:hypothetical protein